MVPNINPRDIKGEMPMKKKTYPVLLSIHQVVNGTEYFRAWCPFCKKWHYHGPGEGHRVAHCGDESRSPFRETGYILKDARKDPLLRSRLKGEVRQK